ncbi:UNVERIFIED_CONTAM: hypothetical protein Slati_3497400 [Sesamum latifolium]|uniref:Uncharacterized protein n=1 Tax=Sesamum latifolium TaxID=2727402 RepID=A0AAW2UKB8_9LAMI
MLRKHFTEGNRDQLLDEYVTIMALHVMHPQLLHVDTIGQIRCVTIRKLKMTNPFTYPPLLLLRRGIYYFGHHIRPLFVNLKLWLITYDLQPGGNANGTSTTGLNSATQSRICSPINLGRATFLSTRFSVNAFLFLWYGWSWGRNYLVAINVARLPTVLQMECTCVITN